MAEEKPGEPPPEELEPTETEVSQPAKDQKNEQIPSEEFPQDAIAIIQQFSARFAGPLPPPELFALYRANDPKAADWILDAATKEQENRHWCDQEPLRQSSRAQIFAFIIVVLAILVGAALIFFDKPIAGLATIMVPLASIAGIFVYRETQSARERREQQNSPT
ncbi:DUF2335 domain-containing protein [soil metagenome]